MQAYKINIYIFNSNELFLFSVSVCFNVNAGSVILLFLVIKSFYTFAMWQDYCTHFGSSLLFVCILWRTQELNQRSLPCGNTDNLRCLGTAVVLDSRSMALRDSAHNLLNRTIALLQKDAYELERMSLLRRRRYMYRFGSYSLSSSNICVTMSRWWGDYCGTQTAI